MASNKPTAEGLALRAQILRVLEAHPGLTSPEVRIEVLKIMPTDAIKISNAFTILCKYGEVRKEPHESRFFRYFISDGRPQIRHVAAADLPKLPGIVRAPMDWVLHQLQGV